MKKLVDLIRSDSEKCVILRDELFVNHVYSDFYSCRSRSFAVSRLEHPEFSVFDRELDILHVAVVKFEFFVDVAEIFVNFGHIFFKRRIFRSSFFFTDVVVVSPFSAAGKSDLLRSSDTCNDIFTLSVDEVFAEENVFACCRISRESNACRAVIAHVSENHGLNVYSGSPVIGEAVHFAVNDSSFVHPASENRVDRAPELFFRIGRKLFSGLLFDDGFVRFNELFQVFDSHFEVVFDAVFVLESCDCVLEVLAFDPHNDVSVHLHETAEAVPCKTGVTVGFDKSLKRIFVKTEVENRVHHAGHRSTSAAAD